MARYYKRKRKTVANTSPLERDEQELLFEWLEWRSISTPELTLAYHIPNEGRRSRRAGGELVKQGMKKGMPDICLPIPRGGYGALYIELKRRHGGRLSEDQRKCLAALNEAGNLAVVCKGFDEAKDVIERYLRGAE